MCEFAKISERGVKCYERRLRCLKHRGWCYAGRNREFGFCNEINELPDTPDADDPLFEVQTLCEAILCAKTTLNFTLLLTARFNPIVIFIFTWF